MATILGGGNITYDKCANDGSAVAAIQCQNDVEVGACNSIAVKDCFVSSSIALLSANTGVGFGMGVQGLTMENNLISGSSSSFLVAGSTNISAPVVVNGNFLSGVTTITDGLQGGPNRVGTPAGISGTTINHYFNPMSALDIDFQPINNVVTSGLMIRAASNGIIYSDKNWTGTLDNLAGGNFEKYDDIQSTNFVGHTGQRHLDAMGYADQIAGAASTTIGVANLSNSILGFGTITMHVNVVGGANPGTDNAYWIIKQRYTKNGNASLFSTPDEIEVQDNIGLTTPTMSIIGSFPSTPIQVICNITSSSTLDTVWTVRFEIDHAGVS
jgi:hypothetical protein